MYDGTELRKIGHLEFSQDLWTVFIKLICNKGNACVRIHILFKKQFNIVAEIWYYDKGHIYIQTEFHFGAYWLVTLYSTSLLPMKTSLNFITPLKNRLLSKDHYATTAKIMQCRELGMNREQHLRSGRGLLFTWRGRWKWITQWDYPEIGPRISS